MSDHFHNLFDPPKGQAIQFNFWYLLKNAPQHTAPLVKWCGYPIVFLCAGLGSYTLCQKIFEAIVENGQNGLPLIGILVGIIGIGIALLIWIGSGWHGQKQVALTEVNKSFKEEYDASTPPLWKFDLIGTSTAKDQISQLSRGNKIIARFENVFSTKANNKIWYIGDIARVEHTSTVAQGYREDFTCIFIQKKFPEIKSKLILTNGGQIEKWAAQNLQLKVHQFTQHLETLRVHHLGAILEFKSVIVDPNKKSTIALHIASQFPTEDNSWGDQIPKSMSQTPADQKQGYQYKYTERPTFKSLFEELTYTKGGFRFRFTTYERATDPMDVEEIIYLDLSIEKKTPKGYQSLARSVQLDTFSYWPGMEGTSQFEGPYYWEQYCKRTAQWLTKACHEHAQQNERLAEKYYTERLLKMSPVSSSSPLFYWNQSDFSKMQTAFSAAEEQGFKLADILILHNLVSFSSRILTKIDVPQKHTTAIGNIHLVYIPIDESAAEQIDSILEVLFKVYLRKEPEDVLLFSQTHVFEYSYFPPFSTDKNLANWIDALDQFEFHLLSQLDLNRNTDLALYLEEYFSSPPIK